MPVANHLSNFHCIQSGAGHLAPGNPGRLLLPSGTWSYLCTVLRISPRGMQIVQGVFGDQKEESIAFELGISRHTVNTYFQRPYTKLHVSSRPQLIVRVMAEYLTLASSSSNGSFVDVVSGGRVRTRQMKTRLVRKRFLAHSWAESAALITAREKEAHQC